MSTDLVGEPLVATAPPVILEGVLTTETELNLIARQIKGHENIAFHQVHEIGAKLNRAAFLCKVKGVSFETWAQEELQYGSSHAHRLMRFAERIHNTTDERLLGVFENASRGALWLLMTAPDSVITEVDALMAEQGTPATLKQIQAIKQKYGANKKAAQATLDTVGLVIENSLDQGIEFRALEGRVAVLTQKLADEAGKVELLERSRSNLRLDLDAATADNDEQSKKIASLENKKSMLAAAPKIDDRDVKKLADAKRELEQTEKKLQETQASLAREQQRVAGINQLVTATEVWLKEVSPDAFLEVMVDMPARGRDILMSMITRSERQLAALKKMLN